MDVRPGYKQTDVGVIPEDWDAMPFIRAVGSYIDYRGRTPRKLGLSWGGGDILALSANNVQMGRIDTDKEAYFGGEELYRKWMVQGECTRGDILLTMEAPLGNVAQIPDAKKYILSQRVLLIRPKDWLLRDFLAHYMRGFFFQRQLFLNSTGSTAKGIQRRKLDDLPIGIPLIKAEQATIADALRDADALIASLEQLLTKKRQLKLGAVQELLTGKRRLPGFEIKFGCKQTDVGVIPEDWTLRPLLSAVCVAKGQVDPKVEPYRSMILVAPDHIEGRSGRLLRKETAGDQRAISGKYVFAGGDIVYSKIRPYLRKAILADFDGLCSADMYPLRPAADVCAGFVLAAILGHHFSKYAESVSVRSGMPKINRSELAEYEIALPPTKAEQEAIAAILNDIDAEIRALEGKVAKARLIKQGMMQELLTGRIRLV